MENLTSDVFGNNSFDQFPVHESRYEKIIVLFWLGVVIYLGIAILSIIGNGLVLKTAMENFNMGRLRHLDAVIKSLAVADMLYGLIGAPCKIAVDYYVGKYNDNWEILPIF